LSGAASVSLLDRQVEALLEHIARYREQSCSELRANAQTQLQSLLRAARHEARTAVHNAVVEARAQLDEERRRTQAAAELEAARRAQRQMRWMLDEMWRELGAALQARWGNPADRKAWIAAAIGTAATLLDTREPWRIEHGPDLPSEAREALERLARQHRPALQIEWRSDDRIAAGLRIRSPGVCLDATVAGLTARRDQVESDYLTQYLAAAPITGPASAAQALPEHSP
jgi:F0F1-type ATP synthase membrane subunit b/b'